MARESATNHAHEALVCGLLVFAHALGMDDTGAGLFGAGVELGLGLRIIEPGMADTLMDQITLAHMEDMCASRDVVMATQACALLDLVECLRASEARHAH